LALEFEALLALGRSETTQVLVQHLLAIDNALGIGSVWPFVGTRGFAMAKKIAYGGVVVDKLGLVLLRSPRGNFDGETWTFPKGRPDSGETAEACALREVREETGIEAEIVQRIPGKFEGVETVTEYFLMSRIRDHGQHDDETDAVRWVSFHEARLLIETSRKATRDLKVLDAAQSLFEQRV
jgi:8-oxo-dGTP pyrophosphatase MutT (NUDIX family)